MMKSGATKLRDTTESRRINCSLVKHITMEEYRSLSYIVRSPRFSCQLEETRFYRFTRCVLIDAGPTSLQWRLTEWMIAQFCPVITKVSRWPDVRDQKRRSYRWTWTGHIASGPLAPRTIGFCSYTSFDSQYRLFSLPYAGVQLRKGSTEIDRKLSEGFSIGF